MAPSRCGREVSRHQGNDGGIMIRIKSPKRDLIPAKAYAALLKGLAKCHNLEQWLAEVKLLHTMHIQHDDRCASNLEESVCNCAPHLVIQLRTDNTPNTPWQPTLVRAIMAILKQYRQGTPAQA